MNPGNLVFQPLSMDPKSACVAFHELTLLRIPHFSHCGIFVENGQMMTASGKVELQDAGATGNIAVGFAWENWTATKAWLFSQMGKPYDFVGWFLAAVQPLTPFYRPPIDPNAYLCSSIVAAALLRNDAARFAALNHRTVTPDDVARAVGAL